MAMDPVGPILGFSWAEDYIGLAVVILTAALLEFFVTPFHRMFYLGDPAIQFPHTLQERVPVGMMLAYAFVIPIAVLAVWAYFFRPPTAKLHATFLAFLLSFFITVTITDMVKNAAGRPRPDLIDRCQPKEATPVNELVDYTVCTQEKWHKLHDGWRSFPSGHSSASFAGLGFLAFFLAGQMRVFRPNVGVCWLLVAFSPMVLAGYIAMSRLADYRHDVYDVTMGTLIGLTVSFTIYRRYYRSLLDRRCSELHWTKDRGSDYAPIGIVPPAGASGGNGSARQFELSPQQETHRSDDQIV